MGRAKILVYNKKGRKRLVARFKNYYNAAVWGKTLPKHKVNDYFLARKAK